jgi:mycothiol-dependent nitroreductase-like protein
MAKAAKKGGHKKRKKAKRAKDFQDLGGQLDSGLRAAPLVPVTPTSVVDFWFDPTCEWTWLTSRWLLEVQELRPIKIVFHLLSLSVLDEGRDLPPETRYRRDAGWAHGRVALAVGDQFGQEQLVAFYTALGTRLHDRNEGFGREVIEAALTDVGLPAELAEAGYTGDNDDALRRSHAEAIAAVGFESGSPVLRINCAAFNGPVFSARPRGEEAGQVFDAVATLDSCAGFAELKRARRAEPAID